MLNKTWKMQYEHFASYYLVQIMAHPFFFVTVYLRVVSPFNWESSDRGIWYRLVKEKVLAIWS